MGFWKGFEKRAYNYEHESKELKQYHKERSTETPISKLQAGLTGAGLGGGLGALIGSMGMDNSPGRVALKGLLGAAIGGGLGLMGAISNKLGIEEAKRITAMPPKEQKEYLRYLARTDEISDKEYRDWSRHYEMMNAVRGRRY